MYKKEEKRNKSESINYNNNTTELAVIQNYTNDEQKLSYSFSLAYAFEQKKQNYENMEMITSFCPIH